MSKNLLAWAGLILVGAVVTYLAFYTNLFQKPGAAPDGDIPYGFFEGSASFANSLTSKGQLAAVGSIVARQTVPPENLAAAKENLGAALVNIICASKSAGVPSISGSGVVIGRDGLIITNSHIAQLFLLSDYPTKSNVVCVIRAGSPARTSYYAELVYLSTPWLDTHSTSLVLQNPKGSGQDDFALLQITRSATAEPLPDAFAFVPLATNGEPSLKEAVAIGSYGAQTLTAEQIRNALTPTLVLGSVQDVYTFEKTSVDLLSLGGSDAAQHGSSGGGVVDAKGNLIAVITTSSTEGSLASRDLRAITADHIRRSFAKDMGVSLDAYLADHTRLTLVSDFAQRNAELRSLLTGVLALNTRR